MQLNLTGFYYKYDGFQVSQLIQRTAVNTNIDASIKGLEFEGIYEPVHGLRLNATIGLLDSNIDSGTSLNTLNRTNSDPNYVVVKASDSSNCIAPRAGVAKLLQAINSGALPATTSLYGFCSGAFAGSFGITPSDGIAQSVKGNQLPNAPSWTVALGAEYSHSFVGDWRWTARADYYRQSDSYARIFNTSSDLIQEWENLNATLTFENKAQGLQVQFYGRNLFDRSTIIGISLSDDIFGLTRAVNVLDPRLYGVTVTKRF